MDMLAGVEGAEMQMNRYLLLCAVLLDCSSSGGDDDECHKDTEEGHGKHSNIHAVIAWKCDLCMGQNPMCPEKNVMLKHAYKIQFRNWKLPGFCRLLSKPSNHPRKNEQARGRTQKQLFLELPLVQCLKTSLEDTPCYHALPDLGKYIRGILQRRYYTEPIRKHWIKACSTTSASISMPAVQKNQPQIQPDHVMQDARTSAHWGYMHGICATLLLESIPCMKRAKRSSSSQMSSSSLPLTRFANDAVETMACINVMHGTLLKLYPLGAKTPTFNARVHLMARMMHLTNGMSTSEQLHFMHSYPSLMRICFMEYSINAMMDWLPCERALLLMAAASTTTTTASAASQMPLQQQQQAMQTYSNIAVAMCDIFRQVRAESMNMCIFNLITFACCGFIMFLAQDAIITGQEPWKKLNSIAAVSIERCIRVCKFKLFKAPEPIVKGPHISHEFFDEVCSMQSRMLQPSSMDLAMQLFNGNRQKASSCMLMHSNLRVFPLPECVAMQQVEAADKMYSACSAR